MQLVWESYKLDPYVQRLAETVFHFQEKVDDLLEMEEQIDVELRAIDTCAYSYATFNEVLNKIQKAVDDLSLHQYSNLPQWVAKLDQEVCIFYSLKFLYILVILVVFPLFFLAVGIDRKMKRQSEWEIILVMDNG